MKKKSDVVKWPEPKYRVGQLVEVRHSFGDNDEPNRYFGKIDQIRGLISKSQRFVEYSVSGVADDILEKNVLRVVE